jgi:AraC-like DNA-binding protein
MSPAGSSLVAVKRVFPGSYLQRCGGRATRRHPYTVLSYQISGELVIEHGGPHTLRSGDLHVIPAGHEHGITAAHDVEMWGVAIAPSLLDAERHAALLAPIERIARGALPRVAVPEERRAFVASLFTELASARPAPLVRNESLVVLLLAELAEHAPQSAVNDRASSGDLATRAVAFVAANALAPLSLDDVARALRSNRTHVADVVRQATGLSVGALITEVRLDEARRRLEETDELVEVIGERVGYADATHFSRMFKRRFGCAPRAWRTGRH